MTSLDNPKSLEIVSFIRELYKSTGEIPLHAPSFVGNEKDYLLECIDSTFVSTAGTFVGCFEKMLSQFLKTNLSPVALVNGTESLHMALLGAGVQPGDLVITQPLTFVATCNAIRYAGADPIFCDVEPDNLSLSPRAIQDFLEEHAVVDEKGCIHKKTGKRIAALLPMHTFGLSARMQELIALCKTWGMELVEDAAESLGSTYNSQQLGTFGRTAAFSFNGNKVITTGGGGAFVSRCSEVTDRIRHLSSTAKCDIGFDFYHDKVGFNYRMPNLNAALGCAQLERLPSILASKARVADSYFEYFRGSEFRCLRALSGTTSNYWLNAIVCPDVDSRNDLLKTTNCQKVFTRPIWRSMASLPMYANCFRGDLSVTNFLQDRVINLPSSPLVPSVT